MQKVCLVMLAVVLMVLPLGCVAGKRQEGVTEVGVISRSERIVAGQGPSWRITAPIVQRSRSVKATNLWGALDTLAAATPDALIAWQFAPAYAAFKLADSLGQWVVPDKSNTQTAIFEGDGLATKVTVAGFTQSEAPDGTVTLSIDTISVEAADDLMILPSPAPEGVPAPTE